MTRYRIDQYPARKGGMQSGYMEPGVKVTDTETGQVAVCTKHRSQHLNKDECLRMLAEARGESA